MNWRILELAISLVVALGFAALGDLILKRRSGDAFILAESFAVGSGVAAALLFPFSLLFSRFALHAELLLLGFAIVVAVIARVDGRLGGHFQVVTSTVRDDIKVIRKDALSIFFLLVIVVIAATFAVYNLRRSMLWDGFQAWATLARVLFEEGRVTLDPVAETKLLDRYVTYPHLIALYEALVARMRGSFDFNGFKPIFLVFYLALLTSMYRAARELSGVRVALATTMFVAALPPISTHYAVGGYADMPMAMYIVAAVSAVLRESDSETGWFAAGPWLLGSLPMVKDEGLLLLMIGCGTIALSWLGRGGHGFVSRLRSHWRGAVLIAFMFALRRAHLAWVDYGPNLEFLPLKPENLAFAFGRAGEVYRICLHYLLNFKQWGLFWPAYLLSAAIVLVMGSLRQRALLLASFSALLMYSSIFLLTNWPVPAHIDNAYDRLVTQLAPLAALVILSAYSVMSSPRSPERADDGPSFSRVFDPAEKESRRS